jgi:hypothetical protein
MKKFIFETRTKQQLRNWYNGKMRQKNMGFRTYEIFERWYQKQPKQCHYCHIEEVVVQEIVMRGLLTSARFPKIGLKARGRNRGKWLEVDRKNPLRKYSAANCVLACYFCNNDKSDVFDELQYQAFKENRACFLRGLLR